MVGISLHSQILHWGPHELSACAGPTRVYYGIRLQLVLLQTFTNHNTKAFESTANNKTVLWPLQDQLVKAWPYRLISPSRFLFLKKGFDTP